MTPVDPVASGAPSRDRVRLVVVLGLLGAWFLRWATVQTVVGTEIQNGPARAGAVGAIALVVAWGLAVTLFAGRDRRGWRLGAAVTDLAVAILTVLGLRHAHSALAAPASAVLVFVALALLAILQIAVSARPDGPGRDVALVRGIAALLAAALLAVGGAWPAAGIAAVLAASAFLAGSRRGLEVLLLTIALIVILAPRVNDAVLGTSLEQVGVYEGYYLWLLGGATLALLSLVGFFRRHPA